MIFKIYNIQYGDFSGGPVAKTPHFQCRGPRFHSWSGNQIPHTATKDPASKTEEPVSLS